MPGKLGSIKKGKGGVDVQSLMHDMNMCVETIQDLRNQNPEALPSLIWEKLFRMTNICPTFEIVLAVFENKNFLPSFKGWALQQRPADDSNWPGLYACPGDCSSS